MLKTRSCEFNAIDPGNSCLFASAGLSDACAARSTPRNKKPRRLHRKDEIEVVGHIPLTGAGETLPRHSTLQQLLSLRRTRTGGNVTLIDVTKSNQPAVLADVAYAPNGGSDSLTVVAGTAALVTSEPAASDGRTARRRPSGSWIFRIRKNPKVAREFTGVTAMSRDEARGLIFVANADGIWILRQHLAEDPEVQKAYDDTYCTRR